MLCFYSAKGGVGCSAVAASVAVLSAATRPTLLVDLHGELESLLGLDESEVGLSDWFGADEPSPDLLGRLERHVDGRLSLLPRGPGRSPARPVRYRTLAPLLAADDRTVVVDVGTHAVPAVAVLGDAHSSFLVTRACYLALRAARCLPTPDGVVVVSEPARSIAPEDIEAALGAPIGATVRWHPDVARAIDAGLFRVRLPRTARSLLDLVP